MSESERLRLAEAVRTACLAAAVQSYERARTDGLCDEGAFEVAMDALRGLDLRAFAENASQAGGR